MNDLVQWEQELARHAKEVAALERPSVAQIGLRAGVMMYQGQAIPGNKLDCIIVAFATEHRYDTEAFDPNNIKPPTCFSLSLTGDGMVPSDKSPELQAETCDECPHSKWQANPKRPGKNFKACKERRRLALLPADVIRSGNFKTAELAVLSVSVTSVKNWASYVNRLVAEFGRPPWAMVSEISVTPNPHTQFQINFNAKNPIEEQYLTDIYNRITAAQDQLLVPYDTSGLIVPGSDPMKPTKERKF